MPAMGDDVGTDRGHGPLLQGFITYLPFKHQTFGAGLQTPSRM